MHKYKDPRKQAIVNRAQAAIDLADSIIASMRARVEVRHEQPKFDWSVKIRDLSTEEQAKIVRMENKPR